MRVPFNKVLIDFDPNIEEVGGFELSSVEDLQHHYLQMVMKFLLRVLISLILARDIIPKIMIIDFLKFNLM